MNTKYELNDMLIVHDEIGMMCLQMRFKEVGGTATFGWQMPFKLGYPLDNAIMDLDALARGIKKSEMDYQRPPTP